MPVTREIFKVGERVVVEVHGYNYPEGVYEGVVESVSEYDPYKNRREDEETVYAYAVRFDDPNLALSERWREYNNQLATGNSNLYKIGVMRLFKRIEALRDELAGEQTRHAIRERALLDAIKDAGKDAVIETIEKASHAAVYTAVEKVFEPTQTTLRALVSRVDDLVRVGMKVFTEGRKQGGG